MPKFILINKDGMYLGQEAWVPLAALARVFDADEAVEQMRSHEHCFIWQVANVPPTGGYTPERMRNRPEFRDTCRAIAA